MSLDFKAETCTGIFFVLSMGARNCRVRVHLKYLTLIACGEYGSCVSDQVVCGITFSHSGGRFDLSPPSVRVYMSASCREKGVQRCLSSTVAPWERGPIPSSLAPDPSTKVGLRCFGAPPHPTLLCLNFKKYLPAGGSLVQFEFGIRPSPPHTPKKVGL